VPSYRVTEPLKNASQANRRRVAWIALFYIPWDRYIARWHIPKKSGTVVSNSLAETNRRGHLESPGLLPNSGRRRSNVKTAHVEPTVSKHPRVLRDGRLRRIHGDASEDYTGMRAGAEQGSDAGAPTSVVSGTLTSMPSTPPRSWEISTTPNENEEKEMIDRDPVHARSGPVERNTKEGEKGPSFSPDNSAPAGKSLAGAH